MGSAVFNILFVIGMCALVSKTVLDLTWWPLFRDVTFYSVDLILLIGFFYDGEIYWYEALVLFFGYIAYVLFMKYNEHIEAKFKQCLRKRCNKVDTQEVCICIYFTPLFHICVMRACKFAIIHLTENHKELIINF